MRHASYLPGRVFLFYRAKLVYPEKIIKGEPPNIKKRPNKQSAITDGTGGKEEDRRREAVMREFVREYGKGVRQENVHSKTKELTGTPPHALSMLPSQLHLKIAKTLQRPAKLWMPTLRCRVELCGCRPYTILKEDVVAVRHDRRREISPFWLTVLLEDVQVEVNDRKFLRQKVALQWLNQTSDPLTYTPGDSCNRNSPKCILTEVVGYTGEGANITLSSEEDTRLCRLANGDLSDDEDVEDTEDAEVFVDTAAEPTEDERRESFASEIAWG